MVLTLTNGTILNCLDNSTSNELFFDYDKTTFISLLDNFTFSNLNGALLELIDDENNVLRTDSIVLKKYTNVEIKNNIVCVSLTRMTSLEQDIMNLQESIDEVMTALESMIFEEEVV